jgi:hypothetical protein
MPKQRECILRFKFSVVFLDFFIKTGLQLVKDIIKYYSYIICILFKNQTFGSLSTKLAFHNVTVIFSTELNKTQKEVKNKFLITGVVIYYFTVF